MKRIAFLFAVCCLLSPAYAVKTERWEINSPAAFMRGKFQRVTVNSESELHLGYGTTKLGEFAKEIWCSAAAKDGTIYFGTGSPADVYAVGADGKATKVFETDAVAITALAFDSRGNLYAGTLADGKIFKIGADKKGVEFCKLRAPYIWALVFDAQDRLYAGSGPDGKIYRVAPDGKAEEWYASEESNILSLAFDADGALLAGGSDRGLLYRITDKAKGAVLHEFAEDEVKSLVVSGRDLYVGVNRQKVKRPRLGGTWKRPSAAEFDDVTQKLATQFGARTAGEAADRNRETPAEARLGNLQDGTLYLRNANGRIDHMLSWNGESILAMALEGDGGVLVGMSGKGHVYRMPASRRWELLFDFEEKQAVTLAVRNGRLAFVGTGNVGNGYLVAAQKAATGEFTTEVHDCRFLTTWGNAAWLGAGAVSVATRTGNTALPDATWSAWSEPAAQSPAKIASPAGRFIQVRATLARASEPTVQALTVFSRSQNQMPDVQSVEIGEKAKVATPEKPAGGETKPDAAAAGSEPKADDGRPKPASSIKHISWRATDKDGDTLVYRLFYKAKDDQLWIPLTRDKPLKKSEHAWDTESVADGWYQVKVVASDEESNPVGDALSCEKISDWFKIDNTRPAVLQLAFDAASGTVAGVARDNLSLIRYLEFSLDGGEWKFFAPKDGVFDDREEAFAVNLPKLEAGPHTIAVRATDEEGNIGVARIAITVK